MHLVQIFLPLYGNDGQPFPKARLDEVRAELTDVFGGVTAFVRAPAVGAWEAPSGEVRRDDVVLLEVMADAIDHDWWQDYRTRLEQRFAQDEIMVRATQVERL